MSFYMSAKMKDLIKKNKYIYILKINKCEPVTCSFTK